MNERKSNQAYANHRGFRVWLAPRRRLCAAFTKAAHVQAHLFARTSIALSHEPTNEVFSLDLAKNNLTIAHWRVLTVLHDAGNQKLIDLSIHTSIGPSTLSRLTEGMQRRRLVARDMLRLMYQ